MVEPTVNDELVASLRRLLLEARHEAKLREARFEALVEELNGDAEVKDAETQLATARAAELEEQLGEVEDELDLERRLNERLQGRLEMLQSELDAASSKTEREVAAVRASYGNAPTRAQYDDLAKRLADSEQLVHHRDLRIKTLQEELRSTRMSRAESSEELRIHQEAKRMAEGMLNAERQVAALREQTTVDGAQAAAATLAANALLSVFSHSCDFAESTWSSSSAMLHSMQRDVLACRERLASKTRGDVGGSSSEASPRRQFVDPALPLPTPPKHHHVAPDASLNSNSTEDSASVSTLPAPELELSGSPAIPGVPPSNTGPYTVGNIGPPTTAANRLTVHDLCFGDFVPGGSVAPTREPSELIPLDGGDYPRRNSNSGSSAAAGNAVPPMISVEDPLGGSASHRSVPLDASVDAIDVHRHPQRSTSPGAFVRGPATTTLSPRMAAAALDKMMSLSTSGPLDPPAERPPTPPLHHHDSDEDDGNSRPAPRRGDASQEDPKLMSISLSEEARLRYIAAVAAVETPEEPRKKSSVRIRLPGHDDAVHTDDTAASQMAE